MNSHFAMLRELRQRPEMFVGNAGSLIKTLQRVELFLLGFELREAYSPKLAPSEWNRKFRTFVSSKEGFSGVGVSGIAFALEQRYCAPMTVWNEFFRLVDEFEGQCTTSAT